MHKWTPEEDLVAYNWSKFSGRGISLSTDQVGAKLGMGGAAFRMRIGNFKAADAAGGVWPAPKNASLPGLRNYANQTALVYRVLKGASQTDVRSWAISVLRRR